MKYKGMPNPRNSSSFEF